MKRESTFVKLGIALNNSGLNKYEADYSSRQLTLRRQTQQHCRNFSKVEHLKQRAHSVLDVPSYPTHPELDY